MGGIGLCQTGGAWKLQNPLLHIFCWQSAAKSPHVRSTVSSLNSENLPDSESEQPFTVTHRLLHGLRMVICRTERETLSADIRNDHIHFGYPRRSSPRNRCVCEYVTAKGSIRIKSVVCKYMRLIIQTEGLLVFFQICFVQKTGSVWAARCVQHMVTWRPSVSQQAKTDASNKQMRNFLTYDILVYCYFGF